MASHSFSMSDLQPPRGDCVSDRPSFCRQNSVIDIEDEDKDTHNPFDATILQKMQSNPEPETKPERFTFKVPTLGPLSKYLKRKQDDTGFPTLKTCDEQSNAKMSFESVPNPPKLRRRNAIDGRLMNQ